MSDGGQSAAGITVAAPPSGQAGVAHGRRHLIQSGVVVLCGRVGNIGLVLLINVLLARMLPPAELGHYFFLQGVGMVASVVGALGQGETSVRLIAIARAQGDSAQAAAVPRAVARLLLMWLPLFFVLLALVVVPPIASRAGLGGTLQPVAGLTAAWACILALRLVAIGMLRGYQEMTIASLADGVSVHVLVVGALVAMWLADVRPSVEIVVSCHIVCGLLILGPAMRAVRQFGLPRLPGPPVPVSRVLTIGVPSVGAAVAGYLGGQLPVLVLGLVGAPSEVARIGVALQIVNALQLFAMMTALVGAPIIAMLKATGDRQRLEDFCRLLAVAAAMPAVAAGLVIVPFSAAILGMVFGPSYAAAATGLQLMVVAKILQLGLGPVYSVLSMTGHERVNAGLQIASLAVRAALVWVGYSVAGLDGVAAGFGLGLVIDAAALAFAIRHYVRIRCHLPFAPAAWRRALNSAALTHGIPGGGP